MCTFLSVCLANCLSVRVGTLEFEGDVILTSYHYIDLDSLAHPGSTCQWRSRSGFSSAAAAAAAAAGLGVGLHCSERERERESEGERDRERPKEKQGGKRERE